MSPENGNRSCAGAVTLALFAGIAIGAAIGILFAPKPGSQTRKELLEKGEKFVELSKESVSDLMEKTRDIAQVGKQKIEELKMMGEEIWEKGSKKVKNTTKKIKDIVEEGQTAAKEAEEYLS